MPLSLAFRRQRPAARPVEAPPRPPSAPDLPAAIVRLSNHIHYHTRRGARLFVQGGQGGGSVSPPPLPQPILPAAPVPHALAPAPSSELRIWRLDRLVSRERVETRRQVEGGERLVSVRRLLRSRTATERNVILRVGDAFMDMKVLEIARDRVLFQRGEAKVTIFMQELLYNSHSLGGK